MARPIEATMETTGHQTPIIKARGLCKTYGRGDKATAALDNLDLTLGTPGTVHGFLGPNGSGKTTTIRCLLGLIRPTTGTVELFGADATKDLHTVIDRVGAIVETPKLFPHYSGRRNLLLLAKTTNCPAARVDEMLDVVGLSSRGNDKFHTYSLGMKQRLAIAAALLKDPELLILDEPANGLDPAGIAEIRTLVRTIADQGKAVLVSSHQLAEIEQVCDDITVINQGKVIESGSLASIRDRQGGARLVVTVGDVARASAILNEAGATTAPGTNPNDLIVHLDPAEAAAVNQVLGQAGVWLEGLRVERDTLESAFLAMTGGVSGDADHQHQMPPPPGSGPVPPPPPPPGPQGPPQTASTPGPPPPAS